MQVAESHTEPHMGSESDVVTFCFYVALVSKRFYMCMFLYKTDCIWTVDQIVYCVLC